RFARGEGDIFRLVKRSRVCPSPQQEPPPRLRGGARGGAVRSEEGRKNPLRLCLHSPAPIRQNRPEPGDPRRALPCPATPARENGDHIQTTEPVSGVGCSNGLSG